MLLNNLRGEIIMKQTFLTEIEIRKVRHLENITIPLDKNKRKHLILTGKNGSGKTSVLESLVTYFDAIMQSSQSSNMGATAVFDSMTDMQNKFNQGNFIFAYYKDEREFQVEPYKNIEKIQLEDHYNINDNPGVKLAKYLVDLKATQAFTKDSEKSKRIDDWFKKFEKILQSIFDDDQLKLKFNDETFQFSIHESNREPFDFNTMSRGYAAILDIINDLIMRMEAKSGLRTNFEMEGVVLIDEIETHLHLELQKKILPVLVGLFPNIQFIVTTHSPFVLNSLENAVIYDLESRTLVEKGLSDVPYSGIVEGYFNTDELSDELRNKFEQYKQLSQKAELNADDYEKIADLELYLDEIPDYLALNLTTEYQELRAKLRNGEV